MAVISTHKEMKERLKKNAIEIVAENGIEHVTTKKVAVASELAEVYIYRYYEGKDDLLKQCFADIDHQIADIFTVRLDEADRAGYDTENIVKSVWDEYWEYLIQNPQCCVFYKYFYYSTYYDDELKRIHQMNLTPIMKKIWGWCKDFSKFNIEYFYIIVTHVIEETMNFVVKIIYGELENNPENVQLIYKTITNPLLQYMENAQNGEYGESK